MFLQTKQTWRQIILAKAVSYLLYETTVIVDVNRTTDHMSMGQSSKKCAKLSLNIR